MQGNNAKIIITTILFLMLIATFNLAVNNPSEEIKLNIGKIGVLNKNDVIEPTNIMISWIGVGSLGKFTISNTGQNGYFEPPFGWGGYEGLFPPGYTSGNGKTGEFPRESQQYYIWSSGLWVGGLLPENEARVATCGMYSDQGALFNLYQSNQKIPKGADLGAGDYLFKQPNSQQKAYQYIWSYQDPGINEKRTELGLTDYLIDFENGGFVSQEDTYTIFGDYFPEDEARCLFSTGYDTAGLGICVEQRTYSFSSASYIFLDYKIKNKNDFPLSDVYVGYFMDTDIGLASDDQTDFVKSFNAGYAYDSDFYESGWSYTPGYVGAVICDARIAGEISSKGMTGFISWTKDSTDAAADKSGTDDLKYNLLKRTTFTKINSPADTRMLVTSGPFETLNPEQEIMYTVAITAGEDLNDFYANIQEAIELFNNAYVTEVTGIEEKNNPVVSKYNLMQNWPNPFNNITTIQFILPNEQNISIKIFDLAGRLLNTIHLKGVMGNNTFHFDAGSLSSGIYYYALEAQNYYKVNKMLLIK